MAATIWRKILTNKAWATQISKHDSSQTLLGTTENTTNMKMQNKSKRKPCKKWEKDLARTRNTETDCKSFDWSDLTKRSALTQKGGHFSCGKPVPHAGAPIVLHGHIPDFRSSSEGGIWSCKGLDPVFEEVLWFESCQDHRLAAGRSDSTVQQSSRSLLETRQWHGADLQGLSVCMDNDRSPFATASFRWKMSFVRVQQEPPWPNGQGVGPLIQKIVGSSPTGSVMINTSFFRLSNFYRASNLSTLHTKIGPPRTQQHLKAPPNCLKLSKFHAKNF